MTPYSAAADGSFSSRASSRSKALRTSSGSWISAARSRNQHQLRLRVTLSPSSSWIAFSCCWKYSLRKYSISDCTCDWILTRLDDLQLAVEDDEDLAQPLLDVDLLEEQLLLLGLQPERRGSRWESALESSTFAVATASSSGGSTGAGR